MNLAGLAFLIITQTLCGRGIIGLFKIQMKPLVLFCVSMIIGTTVMSVLPVILEVFGIPITRTYIILSIITLTFILNIATFRNYDWAVLRRWNFKTPRLYELIFILTFIALLLPAMWRSFFYPPYARDILSGAEALAEYAIREKTIINSVFTVDLASTNNHLKPPLVLGMQIIYKLLVNPFGQTWLIMMTLCFLIWLYNIIREKFHPVVAGIIMLFFLTMPDLYGYTYLLLFDYTNMVLFFGGFYFLALYAYNNRYQYFLFSVFWFALATYVRLETIVLVGMTVPLLVFLFRKNKMPVAKMVISVAVLMGLPALIYFLWIDGFVAHYMPVTFDVNNQLNTSFKDISVIFEKTSLINNRLLFGGIMVYLFGYFVYLFCIILLADIIFFRNSFNLEACIALYGILLVYIAMPVLGYLIPWFDIENTSKRGLFKLFPLMILYMRNSGLLLKISSAIQNYEHPPAEAQTPDKVVSANRKTPAGNRKKR